MNKKENTASLEIFDINTASEKSKTLLQKSKDAYGYIPNLHGVLAGSPNLLEAYQNLHELFANSSFNKEELTVVWQTINVEHECHYCVPAHAGIAKAMKVDDAIINALRDQSELPTKKLQVLHNTTLALTRNRGYISEEELNAFYEEGYTQRNLLDIILGLSQKVISNYTNHIAETPLDDAFQKFSWSK